VKQAIISRTLWVLAGWVFSNIGGQSLQWGTST